MWELRNPIVDKTLHFTFEFLEQAICVVFWMALQKHKLQGVLADGHINTGIDAIDQHTNANVVQLLASHAVHMRMRSVPTRVDVLNQRMVRIEKRVRIDAPTFSRQTNPVDSKKRLGNRMCC